MTLEFVTKRSGLEARPERELTIIPKEECAQLLSEHCVGRLGLIRKGHPVILPVNYAFDGECIVFRTDPGLKLAVAPFRHVAFEVDEIDLDGRTGWSVLIDGFASEIREDTDPRSTLEGGATRKLE